MTKAKMQLPLRHGLRLLFEPARAGRWLSCVLAVALWHHASLTTQLVSAAPRNECSPGTVGDWIVALDQGECTVFKLVGMSLDAQDEATLARLTASLGKSTTIHTLDLFKASISLNALKAIAAGISSSPSALVRVDLSHIAIPDFGNSAITYLFDALWKHASTLQDFHCIGCNIDDTRFDIFVDQAEKHRDDCTLLRLNLYNNALSSANILLRLLAACSELTLVDLSVNQLGDAGVNQLFGALSRIPNRVRTLHLASVGMGQHGAKGVARYLTNQHAYASRLTHLTLAKNAAMGDTATITLANALRSEQATLSFLDLTMTGIGDDGFKALCEMMLYNRALATLHVSVNSISDAGAYALSRVLMTARQMSISSIDLSYNQISSNGLEALLSAVSSEVVADIAPVLRSISVHSNPAPNELVRQVEDAARSLGQRVAEKRRHDIEAALNARNIVSEGSSLAGMGGDGPVIESASTSSVTVADGNQERDKTQQAASGESVHAAFLRRAVCGDSEQACTLDTEKMNEPKPEQEEVRPRWSNEAESSSTQHSCQAANDVECHQQVDTGESQNEHDVAQQRQQQHLLAFLLQHRLEHHYAALVEGGITSVDGLRSYSTAADDTAASASSSKLALQQRLDNVGVKLTAVETNRLFFALKPRNDDSE